MLGNTTFLIFAVLVLRVHQCHPYTPFKTYCCFFTCVSYAEARNRYRLDVRPSNHLSVRHTLVLYQNG